jgi:PAS domain S-box-containing protein
MPDETMPPRPDRRRADRRADTTGATPTVHVLVVDDEAPTLEMLARLLRQEGFAVTTAADGATALDHVAQAVPDVVLTDLQMPTMPGDELCRRLHAIDPDIPVIVMTGHSDSGAVSASLRVGAEDFLIKPIGLDTLVWCVERAIARGAERSEHEHLYRLFNERLVMTTIREQEIADEEAQQRVQLSALMGNLSDGVIVTNHAGHVVLMNRAIREIMGVTDETFADVDALLALAVDDADGVPLLRDARPLSRARRGEIFADCEVVFHRRHGDRRRIVTSGTCVKDEHGTVALAIVVFRDVTELRKLEKARQEYASLISHDLRNPLSNILLCVTLLKESALGRVGATNEALVAARAERNVHRMSAMLEELTEASRLASQGINRHRAPCDLRTIVANAVDALGEERARRIAVEADDAQPLGVYCDRSQLERVVVNLFTNALKYSEQDAPVTARLWRTGSDVDLEVIDQGIGVAPESVKLLFDRYYRTAAGRARSSGLGLGLYIVREIVEAHGGRVTVSSEVGKGSAFRLTLPLDSALG